MAQGDVIIYNGFKLELMRGTHQLQSGGHSLFASLVSGYTPDIDVHDQWTDTGVSTTEYGTGLGYTAGGKAITTQTVTQDNTNDRALFDFDDVLWTSLGPLSPATPSHVIFWNTTPTSPADPLIAYGIIGVTATNGGNYTLQLSTSPSALISLT